MKPVRAVLHAHSVWSYDGHWRLKDIARLYGAWGVNAVMMSEHDTGFEPARFAEYRAECAAASTRSCQLIPGIEYSSPDNDIHILTWGLDRFLAEHRPISETLEAVKWHGGVSVFAHPIRRDAWQKFDPAWTEYLSAIELWNRKSDGITWGQEAWDIVRSTGLPATIGQDFHSLRQLYPLTNKFHLAPGVDLEIGLVDALASGNCIPQVFRQRLLNKAGTPIKFPHNMLERARRGMLPYLKRRKT